MNVKKIDPKFNFFNHTKVDYSEKNFPKLYIRSNSKTLFFTLTDKNGKVLYSCSSGFAGFKGSKRIGTPVVDALARKLCLFSKNLNIHSLVLMIKFNNHLLILTLMRVLADFNIKVVKFIERIPVSHNGCPKKKLRRV